MACCSQLVDRIFFFDACSFRSRSGFVAYALTSFHTRCFCREGPCQTRPCTGIMLCLCGFNETLCHARADIRGPETWRTDILLKSSLQDLMQLQFQMA